jgi:hypothetical protein
MTVPTRVEGERPFNKPAKLKEWILYISQECAADRTTGLHVPQRRSFSLTLLPTKSAAPITGTEYVRERHGQRPVP